MQIQVMLMPCQAQHSNNNKSNNSNSSNFQAQQSQTASSDATLQIRITNRKQAVLRKTSRLFNTPREVAAVRQTQEYHSLIMKEMQKLNRLEIHLRCHQETSKIS